MPNRHEIHNSYATPVVNPDRSLHVADPDLITEAERRSEVFRDKVFRGAILTTVLGASALGLAAKEVDAADIVDEEASQTRMTMNVSDVTDIHPDYANHLKGVTDWLNGNHHLTFELPNSDNDSEELREYTHDELVTFLNAVKNNPDRAEEIARFVAGVEGFGWSEVLENQNSEDHVELVSALQQFEAHPDIADEIAEGLIKLEEAKKASASNIAPDEIDQSVSGGNEAQTGTQNIETGNNVSERGGSRIADVIGEVGEEITQAQGQTLSENSENRDNDKIAGEAAGQPIPTLGPFPTESSDQPTPTTVPHTPTFVPPTEEKTAVPTNTPEVPTGTPDQPTPTTEFHTPTFVPTQTPENTPTDQPTPTPEEHTPTPKDTPTNTPTNTPTATETDTPTPTETDEPTNTPSPTATITDSPTPSSTNTPVPPTETSTPITEVIGLPDTGERSAYGLDKDNLVTAFYSALAVGGVAIALAWYIHNRPRLSLHFSNRIKRLFKRLGINVDEEEASAS